MLELMSHRLMGHSVVDPDRYRDPDYIARIRLDDPITGFAKRLTLARLLDSGALDEIEGEV